MNTIIKHAQAIEDEAIQQDEKIESLEAEILNLQTVTTTAKKSSRSQTSRRSKATTTDAKMQAFSELVEEYELVVSVAKGKHPPSPTIENHKLKELMNDLAEYLGNPAIWECSQRGTVYQPKE